MQGDESPVYFGRRFPKRKSWKEKEISLNLEDVNEDQGNQCAV